MVYFVGLGCFFAWCSAAWVYISAWVCLVWVWFTICDCWVYCVLLALSFGLLDLGIVFLVCFLDFVVVTAVR